MPKVNNTNPKFHRNRASKLSNKHGIGSNAKSWSTESRNTLKKGSRVVSIIPIRAVRPDLHSVYGATQTEQDQQWRRVQTEPRSNTKTSCFEPGADTRPPAAASWTNLTTKSRIRTGPWPRFDHKPIKTPPLTMSTSLGHRPILSPITKSDEKQH